MGTWPLSWVALDTETTGFDKTARIVEIAVVSFDAGQPVHRWSTLLNPMGIDYNDPRVQQALAVNKIHPDDLQGKPTFGDVLSHLLVELSMDVWVAHNAKFDLRMMEQEFARINYPFKPAEHVFCTCAMAAYLTPSAPKNKLEHVAARYGVSQEGAHRADVDAEVAGRIFSRMLEQHPPCAPDMLVKTGQEANHYWNTKSRRRS